MSTTLPPASTATAPREIQRDAQVRAKLLAVPERQEPEHDIAVGESIDGGADGAVSAPDHDEAVALSDGPGRRLRAAAQIPDGVGRIEVEAALAQQPLCLA
jgi:hypothetical protein